MCDEGRLLAAFLLFLGRLKISASLIHVIFELSNLIGSFVIAMSSKFSNTHAVTSVFHCFQKSFKHVTYLSMLQMTYHVSNVHLVRSFVLLPYHALVDRIDN